MTSKYLKILEFDKIVSMACTYATCAETRQGLTEEAPCTTPGDVREALQKTDALTILLIKNGSPRFSNVQRADKAVQRAVKGGVLSMAELLLVGEALRNFSNLVAWYGETEHETLPVDDLFVTLTPQPTLEKHIFACILSETEMADTASDALYDVRRKIRATENSIRDKLDGMIKSQTTGKYLQESVVSLRNGRFVVPVKVEHKSDIGGVIHDVSSSGATLFVEPTAVVEANAKILQLKNQEQAEIERILSALSNATAALEPMFSLGYDAMLHIDRLLAKARLALAQNAMMPQVREDCSFRLVRARHPLIAKEKVVPIDLALGEDYDTLVVTGPNTGGKTVTLKTAGLLSIMAQHGYLIPAHESSAVCVFDDVLADIGDEQSIEQSLSTFSGHIKNITEILSLIGPRTLVLMDELGAGTDPAEGAALAVAILEAMRPTGTKIMATTHYAELKIYALDTPGVQNASCEFNLETLQPTYKISVGVPGKSNAFLISEKLGLPKNIICGAQVHLSSEDKRLDSVLVQLEDLKLALKQGQDEILRLNNVAQTALEKAEQQRAALVQQGETELAAAREKANKMVQDVQTTAYNLMDELVKLEKADKQAAGQRAVRAREIARKETEKLFGRADMTQDTQRHYTPLKSVSLGQEVLLVQLDKRGIVQSLPDKNGMVEVRAGVIKTKVPLSELAAPQKEQKPQKKSHVPSSRMTSGNFTPTGNAVRNASMEINLLGLNTEEALMEVDQFIDNGVLSGQNMLYLIHGKGAGILRKAIHSHLKGHRSVKSYRLGTYGEGEAGVTVVELK
ncbi:MAG: endonuclease MutS2 [Ruthenibacterium sp.]